MEVIPANRVQKLVTSAADINIHFHIPELNALRLLQNFQKYTQKFKKQTKNVIASCDWWEVWNGAEEISQVLRFYSIMKPANRIQQLIPSASEIDQFSRSIPESWKKRRSNSFTVDW